MRRSRCQSRSDGSVAFRTRAHAGTGHAAAAGWSHVPEPVAATVARQLSGRQRRIAAPAAEAGLGGSNTLGMMTTEFHVHSHLLVGGGAPGEWGPLLASRGSDPALTHAATRGAGKTRAAGLSPHSWATPALRPTKPANLRVDDRTTLLSRGAYEWECYNVECLKASSTVLVFSPRPALPITHLTRAKRHHVLRRTVTLAALASSCRLALQTARRRARWSRAPHGRSAAIFRFSAGKGSDVPPPTMMELSIVTGGADVPLSRPVASSERATRESWRRRCRRCPRG